MTATLRVKKQKDGSIELIDIFDALSLQQISKIPELLKANPIFNDEKIDEALMKEVNGLMYNKKLNKQFSILEHSSLEFKMMLSDVIEKLIQYERK